MAPLSPLSSNINFNKKSFSTKNKISWCVLILILFLTPLSFYFYNKFISKPTDIAIQHEKEFIEFVLKNQPDIKFPVLVTLDKNNNFLISISVFISDPAACRDSFVKIREATTDYIRKENPKYAKWEVLPFIIKAKNITLTIP